MSLSNIDGCEISVTTLQLSTTNVTVSWKLNIWCDEDAIFTCGSIINCSLMITPASERYRSDYQIWLCLAVCIVRSPKEVSTIAMVDFKVLKFERTVAMINWQLDRQLWSYADSYDHASLFGSCSYDNWSAAVTVILPENMLTILLISYDYRVFSLVTNDDKWQF